MQLSDLPKKVWAFVIISIKSMVKFYFAIFLEAINIQLYTVVVCLHLDLFEGHVSSKHLTQIIGRVFCFCFPCLNKICACFGTPLLVKFVKHCMMINCVLLYQFLGPCSKFKVIVVSEKWFSWKHHTLFWLVQTQNEKEN